MGMLTQAGQGFGGKAGKGGKAEIIKTLALGMYSGLDKARMPEFFAATSTLVQRQMGAVAGDVDPGAASKLLAMLGASGQSGLQGARGGQVAAALDQAVRRPGGGEAGQAFMLQAMGFGKPGGQSSYYEALRKQQRGIFGDKGENLKAVFAESRAQYGGGQKQILALQSLTGLTIDQLEAVRDVVESNLSGVEKQKALKKIQEEAKSIEAQSLDEMKEFGDTLTDVAGLQDRSIGIGDAIKESVEKIRDMINEAIVKAMPLIVKALEKISEVIQNIWAYVKTWIDPQFSEEQRAKLSGEFAKAKSGTKEETDKAIAAAESRRKVIEKEQKEETATGNVADAALRLASAGWKMIGQVVSGEGDEIDPNATRKALAGTVHATRIREGNALNREIASAHELQRFLSQKATGIYKEFSQRSTQMAEGGMTRKEQEFQARIDKLSARIETLTTEGTTAERIAAITQSQALIDAIDESRRNRATTPPNEDRGTTRQPNRSGQGQR
jgi:hypothetical protein